MRIGLKNGGEIEGEVLHGVLHGKVDFSLRCISIRFPSIDTQYFFHGQVLVRGKANTLIFSGLIENFQVG